MSATIDRRSFLAAAAAALPALAARASAAPADGMEILLAPNGSSVVLVDLVEAGGLSSAAPGATYRLWRTTDDLRAGIVSGRTRLFTTPCHVPANLAARGMPIRFLCLLGLGHLSIVTADETIHSFADLAGKPVLGFFRHDMPDLIFRAIARMEGLDPDKDMTMSYVQTPMEAAQLIAAGQAQTAILSEPPATSAITMAAMHGRTLRRAFDLNSVWGRHKGKARIPMAGIAVHQSLIDDNPEVLAALRAGLVPARDRIVADPAAAAKLAERTMQMRAPVFEKAFPHLNIDVISAKAAKAELIGFYSELLTLDPAAIGGKLPPDAFYLDL